MIITREILLARRQRFDSELEAFIAQANVRKGMIAEIDELLSLQAAPEPPTKPATQPAPGTPPPA